ncbi:putative E3 ubiquitin-protein ligase XBOS32, partial [Cucurbita argyrosperma subsp. argyrosperma]
MRTALMQACQHGHWEVVQTLILFNANIHRSDYLNGGTALHLAALNGHSRCIRLLLADYVPSTPKFWTNNEEPASKFDFRYRHSNLILVGYKFLYSTSSKSLIHFLHLIHQCSQGGG